MPAINHHINCKVAYTRWYYVALLYGRLGLSYPEWLKRKTVAWMVCGEMVRQIKLVECL